MFLFLIILSNTSMCKSITFGLQILLPQFDRCMWKNTHVHLHQSLGIPFFISPLEYFLFKFRNFGKCSCTTEHIKRWSLWEMYIFYGWRFKRITNCKKNTREKRLTKTSLIIVISLGTKYLKYTISVHGNISWISL